MVLLSILFPMLGLIIYGKKIKEFKTRHYVIAILVALFQLSVVVYSMFTMEKPPLY
jgi:hypothetical protein